MEKIKLGQIVTAVGIKGEVKVYPYTDIPERFEEIDSLMIESKTAKINGVRYMKNMVILRLEGVDDRNAAERLKKVYLCVRPEDAVKPKDSFFIFEIIGLDVYEGDKCYGKVINVLQNSSTDLYEVKGEGESFYLPALKSVVQNISLEDGRMDVIIPDGLFD